MTNTGYGTGIVHLMDQAEAKKACILSEMQVLEVAGTLVEMSNEIERMALVAEMQSRIISQAKDFMEDTTWTDFLDQMGLNDPYFFDEEE